MQYLKMFALLHLVVFGFTASCTRRRARDSEASSPVSNQRRCRFHTRRPRCVKGKCGASTCWFAKVKGAEIQAVRCAVHRRVHSTSSLWSTEAAVTHFKHSNTNADVAVTHAATHLGSKTKSFSLKVDRTEETLQRYYAFTIIDHFGDSDFKTFS